LRRFAPEVYESGFRVKPGMTRGFFDCGHFFASSGVGRKTDVRRQETGILVALRAGEMGGRTQFAPTKTARRYPRPAESFFVLRRVAPERLQGE
jgi:hypothetical protein